MRIEYLRVKHLRNIDFDHRQSQLSKFYIQFNGIRKGRTNESVLLTNISKTKKKREEAKNILI